MATNRDVESRFLAEAPPELAGQRYVALLGEVSVTSRAAKRMARRVLFRWGDEAPVKERFVNFVRQPRPDETGAVTKIFVQGSNVTDRVRAKNQHAEGGKPSSA